MSGRGFGQTVAMAVATAAVAGAVLLVALDFATGGDAQGKPDPERQLSDRLKSIADLVLFTTETVPDSQLIVQTSSIFADAEALAAGHFARRRCDVKHAGAPSSFEPTITLGRQQEGDRPILIRASGVTAADAHLFGLKPDELVTLAQRYCRFPG